MGKINPGIPKNSVLELKEISGYSNFVETGTYRGDTTLWASNFFDTVFTIENSKMYYEEFSEILKKNKNVTPIFGNSKKILKKITKKINKNIIFWLDAHWSSGLTYGENDECPLLEELKIIKSNTKGSIIIIDDARLFCKPPCPPYNPDSWPTISQIISCLNNPDETYIVIFDDVIYSVPIAFRKKFINWLTTIDETPVKSSTPHYFAQLIKKIFST